MSHRMGRIGDHIIRANSATLDSSWEIIMVLQSLRISILPRCFAVACKAFRKSSC